MQVAVTHSLHDRPAVATAAGTPADLRPACRTPAEIAIVRSPRGVSRSLCRTPGTSVFVRGWRRIEGNCPLRHWMECVWNSGPILARCGCNDLLETSLQMRLIRESCR